MDITNNITKVLIIGGRGKGKREAIQLFDLKCKSEYVGMDQFDIRETYDQLQTRYDIYLATGFENMPFPKAVDLIKDGLTDEFEMMSKMGVLIDYETLEQFSSMYVDLFAALNEAFEKMVIVFGDVINSEPLKDMIEQMKEVYTEYGRYTKIIEDKPYKKTDAFIPMKYQHQHHKRVKVNARNRLR